MPLDILDDLHLVPADALYAQRESIINNLLLNDLQAEAMITEIDEELLCRGLPVTDPAIDIPF